MALGKYLFINDEKFEELDEILARYIEPMVARVHEIINSHKFFPGTEAEADAKLSHDKSINPNTIAYCFRPAYEQPGKFVLSFRAGATTKNEYISVSPNGIRFRQKYFDTLIELLNWFKSQSSKRK